MNDKPILLSVNNRLVVLEKPPEAIASMGSVYKEAFRRLTFADVVTRSYIQKINLPIEQANDSPNDKIIAELKSSLATLGMQDVEVEVDKAVAAFETLWPVQIAMRLIPFTQWGL